VQAGDSVFRDAEQIRAIFLQLSMFGLVAALWLVGVTLWVVHHKKRTRHLERRLQFAEQGTDQERVLRLWHDGQAVEVFVPGGPRPSLMERLEHIREDAGWTTPMARILAMLVLGTGLAITAIVVLSSNLLLAGATAAVVGLVFRGYLGYCINRRTAIYEKQLVDALDLGGRSLRAGHPLSGAFQMIAQEIGSPLNATFAEIVEQEALGRSLQDALYQSAQRSRSDDMRIFAASVIIQLRSGGNLADMMDRVAWVLRDRMRLHRRARVLTAEAQLSKWILLALPTGLFVVLNILNPRYMLPFYNTFYGFVMIVVGCLMLITGAWCMNWMSKIKY
jgi:tight adherence protein B